MFAPAQTVAPGSRVQANPFSDVPSHPARPSRSVRPSSPQKLHLPIRLLPRPRLPKFLLVALAAVGSGSLRAAPVDFTGTNYVTGTLNSQNGWSVQEDSRYNGAMNIVSGTGLRLIPTTNGGGTPAAFYGSTDTPAANTSFTTSINFNFTESQAAVTASASIVRMVFSDYPNPYLSSWAGGGGFRPRRWDGCLPDDDHQ